MCHTMLCCLEEIFLDLFENGSVLVTLLDASCLLQLQWSPAETR